MKKIVVLLIILGLVVAGIFLNDPKGVQVTVVNQGQNPITDVRLTFTGGSHDIGDLPPNEPVQFNLEPSGESSVTVSFSDSLGNSQSRLVDVYVEPGYDGTLLIFIDGDIGEVAWEADIHL
jgi:hypothetical protein